MNLAKGGCWTLWELHAEVNSTENLLCGRKIEWFDRLCDSKLAGSGLSKAGKAAEGDNGEY